MTVLQKTWWQQRLHHKNFLRPAAQRSQVSLRFRITPQKDPHRASSSSHSSSTLVSCLLLDGLSGMASYCSKSKTKSKTSFLNALRAIPTSTQSSSPRFSRWQHSKRQSKITQSRCSIGSFVLENFLLKVKQENRKWRCSASAFSEWLSMSSVLSLW